MTRDIFYGIDWSGTALGAPAHWPAELRQLVSILLDSVQPMFCMWGMDKTLLFNNAFATLLGDDYLDALGKPVALVWKEVWHEIEPYINDAYNGQSSLHKDRPYKTWASNFKEVRYYTFSYSPVKNSAGKVCGALCIANDTTDSVSATVRIRQERNRLRTLFDDAPVFLAMGTAPDMRFTYANKRYEKLVGKSGLVGQTVADVLPEIAAQGYLQILGEVMNTGKAHVAHDVSYLRCGESGPEQRFIDFIYQPLVNESGDVEGILCAGYDVTEQHEAREEALRLRSRLEQTSRLNAMAHMAATMAHELNQPLAAAMNYLNGGLHVLTAEEAEVDLVKTALIEALKQVERSGAIIKRARAAVSRKPPTKLPVDLRSLVQDAVNSAYAADSVATTVGVRNQVDPGIEVRVDRVQIEQVLLNLLRNAADAMGGNGTIEITGHDQGDFVTISVRDSGPGLDLEKEIFTPFIQAGSGMGIGLALSRTIIEAHGGRIHADNAPGGGAVFELTLPKPKQHSVPAEAMVTDG